MANGVDEMRKALVVAQAAEDWPLLSVPDAFCRGFEQGWQRYPAKGMGVAEACGPVSTMDEFATTESPLLLDFVKKVLTLLTAEINGEHLTGMPCWCGPERIEVHQTVELALGEDTE